MKTRIRLSRELIEEIHRLYKEDLLSTRQIAARLNLSNSCIWRRIKKSGESRTASEANILRFPATSGTPRGSRKRARNLWKRAFGEIPRGYHIHHKDGDYLNNTLDNLELLPAEVHRNLHTLRGEDGHTAKFTNAQVNEARRLFNEENLSKTEIGQRLRMSLTHVSGIILGTRRT